MPAEAKITQTKLSGQLAERDTSLITEKAISIWKDVGLALSPIIGQPGVDALFKRSVFLTRGAYPCLAILFEVKAHSDDWAVLQATLEQQTSATAVAAHAALLKNFQDLLPPLIGLSLTERLLSQVWDKPSSGKAAMATAS